MIWLIGNKGMLGSEIARQLESYEMAFAGTDREVDITSFDALDAFASNLAAQGTPVQFIINCAAYTAVEKAETDQVIAAALNETGPRNIARTAKKHGAKMIHISTDYVFDGTGKTPYTEDMAIAPLGVYGRTKAEGEKAAAQELDDLWIFRTAWLYGADGPNFVYTMIRLMNEKPLLKVVNDQWGTPTYAADLARTIILFIKHNSAPSGIYHCTNIGETTWFDFASEIYAAGVEKKIIKNACTVQPCTTAEYGAKVARPAYSVLSKDKILALPYIALPPWQISLRAFLSSPEFKKQEK